MESTLRDIQKPSRHGPGQPVLSNPAGVERLDKVTSRGPYQPQLLCDTANINFQVNH